MIGHVAVRRDRGDHAQALRRAAVGVLFAISTVALVLGWAAGSPSGIQLLVRIAKRKERTG